MFQFACSQNDLKGKRPAIMEDNATQHKRRVVDSGHRLSWPKKTQIDGAHKQSTHSDN